MLKFANYETTIHFVGIGGIGMSGIAEIMHSLGYNVQGSDKSSSQNTERLERIGINVFIGHSTANIQNANVIVFSSAIKSDNIELQEARRKQMPCLSRAEMLSQIVRFKKSVVIAGSHGKTTVTSMCAAILEMAGFDPTVVNGGVINTYKTNAKLGSGDWAVIESDESDGSFVHFFPTIGVITNIDHEHITHYGSFENLKTAFKTYLNNIPFYGAGIVSIDDENVREIINTITDRKIITYALNRDATYMATNILQTQDYSSFDVLYNGKKCSVEIPLMGEHNIKNAIATFAVGTELGISESVMQSALKAFTGVNRRFTNIGTINGALCIDDYAHHPTEIKALIKSAKQKVRGTITIVCQPHRFTRLNLLFKEFCECFDGADRIIVMPVYKADDKETANITSGDLYASIRKKYQNVLFANDKEDLGKILSEIRFTEDDIILFAGAGSISKWAREIVNNIVD